jgi:hypothetical protein
MYGTAVSMFNKGVNETLQRLKGIKETSGETTPPLPPGDGVVVSSDSPDFWLLATAALFENSDPQGAADVAQAIYNRVSMPGDPWKVNNSIRTAILNPGQFQPVRQYGGRSAWDKIKDKESALAFIKTHGKSQKQLESVSSALLNTTRQRSAKNFVGPRDSFRSVSYENANDHLADDTEVRRHGHVFGFEPRGATIASFRAGKLRPAEISSTTRGTVTPVSVSGDIKDTGIKDSQGRPIKLKGIIANAFIDMAAEARKQGIDLGKGISSSLRDPEHNARIGGASGSRHLTGEAFDINWDSAAGKWIRLNASKFGFQYNSYSSTSTHFDWVGGYTPQSTRAIPTPQQNKPQPRSPSPTRTRPSTADQLRNVKGVSQETIKKIEKQVSSAEIKTSSGLSSQVATVNRSSDVAYAQETNTHLVFVTT